MEYGKFNSAEELMKGYAELEKSFTQKCQQLSALQKQLGSSGTSETSPPQDQADPRQSTAVDDVEAVPAKDADSPLPVNQASDKPDVLKLIRQYLEEHPQDIDLLLKKDKNVVLPKVMTEGGNVSMALPSRPKTIKEASVMAKELFK